MFLDILKEGLEDKVKEIPGNKPKKVIKFLNGKRTIKWKCGDGYKWNPSIRRCERIEMSTIRKMKLGAKKRIRQMKARMGSIVRKRAKSIKIRNSRM